MISPQRLGDACLQQSVLSRRWVLSVGFRLFKNNADFGLTLQFLVLLYLLPLAEKSPSEEKPLTGEEPPQAAGMTVEE